MTDQRDIERILDRWLAEGSTEVADRVVLRALNTVEHTKQRRASGTSRRYQAMNMNWRLAVAAALVIAVGGGLVWVASHQLNSSGSGGNVPSTAPSTQPTSANPAPTSRVSGATILLRGTRLVAGTVYATANFNPVFTITGATDWALGGEGPGVAWFVKGPGEPNPPDDFGFGLIRPAKVLPVGGGSSQPLPPDLIAWLGARTDLTLTKPTTVSVAGLTGTMVDGTIQAGAKLNGGGAVNLICSADTTCDYDAGNELGFSPDSHFEIIVVDVRGQTVVIEMDTHAATWARDRHFLDDMLASLTFP